MSVVERLDEIMIFLKQLKPVLEKIEKDLQKSADPEAIAAKIIKDLTDVIQSCPCNEEILKELKKTPQQEIVTSQSPETSNPKGGLRKYSFPNFLVGNEELGSSGDPKALTWPFPK